MQVARAVHKISVAFPKMSKDFLNLLTERIVKSGMSSKRLEYAVNHVIDTFTYQQITIADVLSLDVKCKILTYSEMCHEAHKRGCSTDEYAPIRIEGAEKPGWILKVDKAQYGLPDKI